MQLSIGMIVKNEEKYLDRCLAAIKPILDSLDSELIIADTGSTDSTVEIAKKYTDNVFHFEWIKDFAAARNSTLDRAKGEWYMFLDADEIFKSCNDIIHFFKSGEYKKYQTARYTVRNYDSLDMNHYSDVLVPRLIRRNGVRFQFPIHECFERFEQPTKILTDIADHYGYIDDGDLQEKKYLRNTELLEERLKHEANPPMILYLQLYQSYNLHNEEMAEHYMKLGMEKCRERNDIILLGFYGEKAARHFRNKDWEGILQTAKEYFALPEAVRPGTMGTDAEIHIFSAVALRMLHRYDESIGEYLEFFRLFKSIENGKLQTPDMLVYCFSAAVKSNVANALIELIDSCIHCGKYEIAAQNLKIVKIPELYDRPEIKGLLRSEFIIMTHTGMYNRAAQLYEQLNDQGRTLLQAFVRSSIETNDNPLEEIAYFKKLYKNEPMMSALLNMLEVHFTTGDSSAQVKKMIADGFGAYYELLYFMLKESQDFTPLLRDTFDLRAAAVFCRNLFDDMYDAAAAYDVDRQQTGEALMSALRVLETTMQLMAEDQKDISGVLAVWAKAGSRVCETTEDLDNVPARALGAAMANNIIAARRQKDYKVCAAAMKMLLKTYPESKPIVAALTKDINKELAELNKPKQVTEMDVLAKTVKDNIRQLISNGEFQQASQLLEEFAAISPNDPDIGELKRQMAQ